MSYQYRPCLILHLVPDMDNYQIWQEFFIATQLQVNKHRPITLRIPWNDVGSPALRGGKDDSAT